MSFGSFSLLKRAFQLQDRQVDWYRAVLVVTAARGG